MRIIPGKIQKKPAFTSSRPTESEKIQAFLSGEYVPHLDTSGWIGDLITPSRRVYEYPLEHATLLLDNILQKAIEQSDDSKVIPLSGGWDSRVLVAGLTEARQEFVAVSFGAPGQLDYEIGGRVADFSGSDHVAVNLDEVPVDWEALCQVAKVAPWTPVLDAFYNSIACERARLGAGKTGSLWSGFLGDPLTGGHYNNHQLLDQAAAAIYRKREHLHILFSESEWYDFAGRQRWYTAPICFGKPWRGWNINQGKGWAGLTVIAPFADPEWAGFWLGAPRILHKNQQLYKKLITKRFPDFFKLPSKYTLGVPPAAFGRRAFRRLSIYTRNRMHGVAPGLGTKSVLLENYLNFFEAFRKREDFRCIIERALSVIRETGVFPYAQAHSAWREHSCGKSDQSALLKSLVGLAVNVDIDNRRHPRGR